MPAPTPVSRCALRTTARTIPRCRPARFLGPVAATRIAKGALRVAATGMPNAAAVRSFSTAMRLRMAAEEESFDPATIERESDEVDVCIIGAGPAGLSAAIRLKQLANEAGNEDFRVLVLEKAGEVGAHILSGAGVATNDLGIGRDGKPKDSFERGMEFHARVTMFGEGCHGSLTKKVVSEFDLRRDSQHQTYGLGVKEVWEVDPAKFEKGLVVHSMGYPLPKEVYGGSFMYHFGENLVTVGLVVSLDYENPWLSPYQEFQKLKLHPLFKNVLEGGKCISYGARALVEGGFQSIPKVAFPGGALIGDSAGFVNVPKVKGTHNAMKSGMLAAEAAWDALREPSEGTVFLYDYEDALRKSSIWKELKEVRNMRPSWHNPLGVYGGVAYSGLEAYVFKGRVPWTFKHGKPDYAATKPADRFPKIEYDKPDGKITFDILTSVSRTGTNHEEDQPVHLQVKDWDAHTDKAYPPFKGLENRFCPAGVYEYVEDESKPHGVRFQINAQNCIHCKTCDIKAPQQDINWQVPQGGEGPKYYMT
ncbi:hypothetical protein BBK36DRAFT_1166841 [Trichoderma citrinoviride]|uniref:Electron transfer flavoprotein-ubiquinone oxidoreductase n=1 Tax=Trichoderma citrinoviride TaxID=58853 RepID=A0A2T4BI38_9HYPO|nr:hypothetical protein BBK36DRAFT_1166841 [Trichoderma citrinoviride]PTB68970.1 hypothetical protein BBK36DRAFT_1166841 [Trichoderma citrinoviride]